MCYSGRCRFEQGYTGECKIKDFEKVLMFTGESACYIGGNCDCEEEAHQWREDYAKGFVEEWRKIVEENKLVY